MGQRFYKMHGLGNDFVVFDARAEPLAITPARAAALADRHTGIGCDQLIVVGQSDVADVSMRIWNADGSEVESCGNASRCVAALIGRDASIETAGGLIEASLAEGDVAVDMGVPRFDWQAIPLDYAMDTLELPVAWEMLRAPAAVNVGNPHVVFFVDDVAAVPLDRIGPAIETDALFPARININIVQPLSRTEFRMRTWERGAGLTLACGTGACASAIAAMRRGLAERRVTMHLPGGPLIIEWRADDHILMTGPAVTAFIGEVSLADFPA